MPIQSTNPDLTLGNVRPGVYVAVNLAAPGGGVGQLDRRLLIAGYKQASGTAAQDTPFQALSQSDVDTGCGAQSDCARGYSAAISQVGAGNIDVFVLPLAEPNGGTASTYQLLFSFSTGSNPAAPGSVDVSIDGRSILSVGFTTADTATTIASAVSTAINALSDVPVTSSPSSGTVTLTYVHKGAVGEDLPIRAQINGSGTNLQVGPGNVTFSGSATGAGSAQVIIGGTTITAAISNLNTANQSATALAAAINAGSYPVTAAVDGSSPAQVNLFYAPGRDVRRVTTAIVTTTVQTLTANCGIVGSGTPSLTAALTNLAALPAFQGWAVPFVGTQASADTATLGTIATHVELYANGLYQKEQRVHFCAPWPASTLGAIPTGTSPALTSSPRYAALWCQDAGVQGFELACRVAAARVNNDYAAQNWDGFALKGSTASPLVLPASASRPDSPTINTAMRSYYLTPLRVNEGTNQLVIEKGTTTSNSSYLPLRDFSTIDQIAFWRFSLAQRLVDRFAASSLKKFGKPKTAHTITAQAVADEAYLLALEWDALDLYDGAETFKAGFQATVNAQNPTRIDLSFPASPVLVLHQIGAQANLVSPSA